jgi:hypothetical protein
MTTPQKRPLLTAESTFGFSERINHETRPDRGRNTHTDPKTPKFCGPSRQSAGRWLREAGTIPRRLVTEAKRTGSRAISRCVRAIVPWDQYRGDGLKPFWKASRRLFSSVEAAATDWDATAAPQALLRGQGRNVSWFSLAPCRVSPLE